MLRVEGLPSTYPGADRPVAAESNFEVHEGEVFSLLGPGAPARPPAKVC